MAEDPRKPIAMSDGELLLCTHSGEYNSTSRRLGEATLVFRYARRSAEAIEKQARRMFRFSWESEQIPIQKAKMQILKAQLSLSVDKERFLEAWEIGAKGSGRAAVDFEFQTGGLMIARIYSSPGTLWEEDNFKKVVAMALSRVAPTCKINWF